MWLLWRKNKYNAKKSMENEKKGGNSIITPYYPAVENRRIPKNEKKYPADIKFDGHDRYINRGMEKFGREYLLW